MFANDRILKDDREFMEMAINEARKSLGEDIRTHPKVGAVVVKDGRVLASSHRGELAKGDHAEYTALEKKLPDETIAGATIYTRLEPCTTRNHPKIPCAKRLIERKVKRVVIGTLDPNPKISGKGVQLLRKHNVEIDVFPTDLMAVLEELNRDFIRAHSQDSDSLAEIPKSQVVAACKVPEITAKVPAAQDATIPNVSETRLLEQFLNQHTQQKT